MRALPLAALLLAFAPAAAADTAVEAIRLDPEGPLEVGVAARLLVDLRVDCVQSRELAAQWRADAPGITVIGPDRVAVPPEACLPGQLHRVAYIVMASEEAPGEQDIRLAVEMAPRDRLPGIAADSASGHIVVQVAFLGLLGGDVPQPTQEVVVVHVAPAGPLAALAALGLAAAARRP